MSIALTAIIGFEPLICRDDAEAIERAKRMVSGHDIELWSGERLVIRIDHKPKLRPPQLADYRVLPAD